MKTPKAKWIDERYKGNRDPYLVYRASNGIKLASVSLIDDYNYATGRKRRIVSASLWIVHDSDSEVDRQRFDDIESAKKWVQKQIRIIFNTFE